MKVCTGSHGLVCGVRFVPEIIALYEVEGLSRELQHYMWRQVCTRIPSFVYGGRFVLEVIALYIQAGLCWKS